MAIDLPSEASSLASDKLLRPFLAPNFDAADYLNATLPSWTPTSGPASQRTSSSVTLLELATQTQSLMTQLNAQLTRLSNTLTQLTDEILRGGGRLAYEVEVLQGDTSSLTDSLTDGLREDIERFLPGGVSLDATLSAKPLHASGHRASLSVSATPMALAQSPADIRRLHMLTVVRTRLEEVTKVFDQAMKWAMPPSELSLKSSFVSVSSPDPGADNQSREQVGREACEGIKAEISELIGSDGRPADEAFDAALQRIEDLRQLARVFKGTAEEKARTKFLDGLKNMVEDRRPRNRDMAYHLQPENQSRSSSARR